MQCHTAVEPRARHVAIEAESRRLTNPPLVRQTSASMSFGPFRLFPAGRLLEMDGRPLALGDRALDILVVLAEGAGEIVTHRELLERVWRGLIVSPSNLRVQMNALRKALKDFSGEGRYITNVKGQGYCFVAPIHRHDHEAPIFSEMERAALAWTEAVTRAADCPVSDAVFARAREWFTDVEIVNLTMIIAATTAWNRVELSLSCPNLQDINRD
jgi:DNA-binding winged helix-turn-helix (wHTH) protein